MMVEELALLRAIFYFKEKLMANRQSTQGQIASFNTVPATRISGVGSQLETDVNGNLKTVLTASAATIIGTVAIDQTTPGTTNRVVAAGVAASNAAASGNPVLVGAKYNLTPQVFDDGDVSNLQSDVNGNVLNSMGTALASNIDSITSYPYGHTYTRIVTGTTTTLKTGAGVLHTITFNKPVLSEVWTVYDNTAGSGTVIAIITLPATLVGEGPTTAIYDIAFSTGLTIVSSSTTDGTVSWR